MDPSLLASLEATAPGSASRDDKVVIVFGATSYLGQYVLDDLLARGRRIVAVTRNPAISEILLQRWHGRITISAPDQLTVGEGSVEAIVNLAYVKVEKPHRLFRQNERLMKAIHDTSARLSVERLIHVSTMAVFGYEFAGPPQPVHAIRRSGDPYVESKVHAEHLLEELQRRAGYELEIVRLGNVVGEGSPVWTANLAQRLLDGRPVAVLGRDGFSNAAVAANIAHYLGHLLEAPAGVRHAVGRYHHFADLSALRWSVIIDRFAEAVGVGPVLARRVPASVRPSLRPAVAGTVKKLYSGPLGSLTRRSLARVNADATIDAAMFATKTALAAAREADPFESPQDRDLLAILSSEHEFRSHVLPGWTPPVQADEALERMARWIVEAGFSVGPQLRS
jgi:nucleoside-diphosphate-sugar epimerase